MNEQVYLTGEDLKGRFLDLIQVASVPAARDWIKVLDDVRSSSFRGSFAGTAYWLDSHQRRQETAEALDTGLSDELSRVVRELSVAQDELLVMFLIHHSGYGHLLWLTSDLSSVVTYLRLKDRRASTNA